MTLLTQVLADTCGEPSKLTEHTCFHRTRSVGFGQAIQLRHFRAVTGPQPCQRRQTGPPYDNSTLLTDSNASQVLNSLREPKAVCERAFLFFLSCLYYRDPTISIFHYETNNVKDKRKKKTKGKNKNLDLKIQKLKYCLLTDSPGL